MEDTLEDYIRISRNTDVKQKEANAKISKDFLLTAQRRKECEAYALKIVEFLIEGKLRPEIFLRCLKYINPEYYQDVVEERAISSLCGYSLCGKKITNMPKQKYIISSKANKVYEISERKNYCSNFCYKASMHIKNQLDTSPLWIRNKTETTQIRLLAPSEMGVPGILVDQGVATPAPEQSSFTSISQFTEASLQLVEEIEMRPNQASKLKSNLKTHRQSSLNVIDEENDQDNCDNDTQSDTDEERSVTCDSEIEEINVRISSIKFEEREEIRIEKPTINKEDKNKIKTMNEKEKLEYLKKKLKINTEPKTKLVEAMPMKVRKTKLEVITEDTTENIVQDPECKMIDPVLLKIKSCMMSWLTMDTYIYIHGENKIKGIVNERKLSEYFERLQLDGLRQDLHVKYMNICKKVQLQEWAEDKFDSTVMKKNNLKPIPNFQKLKQDSKEMQLKVQSYLTGVLYEQEDTNFPTQNKNKDNEDEAAVLPLVDVYAKTALRRRIFFNSINKMLKKHIQEFKLGGNSILSEIHDLVKTFQLEAYNIVFKPAQWNIISLVLLDMLAIKDYNLKKNLQDPRWREYMSLFTNKLSGADLFYKDILRIIEDVDVFVERHLT